MAALVESMPAPRHQAHYSVCNGRFAAHIQKPRMSRVCAGDSLMSFPAKLAAAEDRLNATLAGTHRLKPVAEKFYATLNDEQKVQVNSLVDWPGL